MRTGKGTGDRAKGWVARFRLVGLLELAIALLLIGLGSAYVPDRTFGQNAIVYGQASGPETVSNQAIVTGHDGALNQCSDTAPQTSGSYKFQRQGESFDIPLNGTDCQAVELELRWSNGRNNGSNFRVIFLDSDNQPIYTKELSGFLTGSFRFPLATLEAQPWLSSSSMMSVVSVPATVVIETVRPFAFPANIAYTVMRSTGQRRQQQPVVNSDSGTVNTGKALRLKVESTDFANCAAGKARWP
ncbi:MAG: hypothetical protein ABJB61_11335 [bacterium]